MLYIYYTKIFRSKEHTFTFYITFSLLLLLFNCLLVLLSFCLIIYIIFLLFQICFNLEHFDLDIIYKDIFRISFKLNLSNDIHILKRS